MLVIVQGQLEAYNQRDIKNFCRWFHPEVATQNLVTGKMGAQGMEQFEESYKRLFEANPALHCEIKSRIVHEFTVFDEELVTGLGRAPQGLHASAIYAFRDGLIDRVWFIS